MPVAIDYYLSLTSPWTYLGSARFAEIAERNGATVNIKPCKFGPIFEQTGGLPLPKRSPQRRAYRMMELKRWREVLGIPINLEPELRAGAPSDAELDKLHEKFTQEALTAGVFGAPSYVLPSGEIFWGQDRLELLECALKKLA
jgi:2-hydroxychromene-2-carboxylate isomerase